MLGFPQSEECRDNEGVPPALADTSKKPDKGANQGA
ncbi:MAG: hypothetical protein ACI9OI_000609 [Chitinophagales bacterium]|jgi:hypothetical protein